MGYHPVLYFQIQITERYSTAMCYRNMCYVFILPQLNPRMSPLPVSSFKLHLFRTDNRHPYPSKQSHHVCYHSVTVYQQCRKYADLCGVILEMKLKFHEKGEFVLHKYTENLQEAILKI